MSLLKSDGHLHPRLVKLVENPQLSETLDYVIREGHQVVGRWTMDDTTPDIMLRGALIAPSHWSVAARYVKTCSLIVITGLSAVFLLQ